MFVLLYLRNVWFTYHPYLHCSISNVERRRFPYYFDQELLKLLDMTQYIYDKIESVLLLQQMLVRIKQNKKRFLSQTIIITSSDIKSFAYISIN